MAVGMIHPFSRFGILFGRQGPFGLWKEESMDDSRDRSEAYTYENKKVDFRRLHDAVRE